jgi:hypothetical protein
MDKQEFVVDAAYRYIPIYQSFDDILDTLLNHTQNCIFNALGRDYYFDIDIYADNKFRAQIFPYLSYPRGINPVAFASYRDVKKGKKGFLYYKEKLVLITFEEKGWSLDDIQQIFSPGRYLEAIMYSIPVEPMPEVPMGLDVVTLYGFYNPKTDNFTVTKFDECRGYKNYGYTVQVTDTWEKIAKKFGTTVENIRTIRNEYNPDQCLVPGNFIVVRGVVDKIQANFQ